MTERNRVAKLWYPVWISEQEDPQEINRSITERIRSVVGDSYESMEQSSGPEFLFREEGTETYLHHFKVASLMELQDIRVLLMETEKRFSTAQLG